MKQRELKLADESNGCVGCFFNDDAYGNCPRYQRLDLQGDLVCYRHQMIWVLKPAEE